MIATEVFALIPDKDSQGITGSDLLVLSGVSAGELWNAMQALERYGLIANHGLVWNKTDKTEAVDE